MAKAKLKPIQEIFQPRELTITLESQEELDALEFLARYDTSVPNFLKVTQNMRSDLVDPLGDVFQAINCTLYL